MRPRLPRTPLLALAALVLASAASAPALSAAEVKLVRVWPKHRDAGSFTRIGEYFGGKEKTRELVVRSQATSRDGYYFLTRFETSEPLPGAIVAIEYLVPGDENARLQFFPVDLPKGSRAVLAGLTGSDWPKADVTPTAWRLRLLGPDGAELAREQSFLWSLPPAPAAVSAAAPAPDAVPAPAPAS